ncbi:MAG: hypothetical protein HW390_2847 [Candidatus Brocadiaceae bacterium]|nr:hypothetical protein [Candidatus Brocadiaceae bacterium]
MKIIGFITDQQIIRQTLKHLGLWTPAPSRDPPYIILWRVQVCNLNPHFILVITMGLFQVGVAIVHVVFGAV